MRYPHPSLVPEPVVPSPLPVSDLEEAPKELRVTRRRPASWPPVEACVPAGSLFRTPTYHQVGRYFVASSYDESLPPTAWDIYEEARIRRVLLFATWLQEQIEARLGPGAPTSPAELWPLKKAWLLERGFSDGCFRRWFSRGGLPSPQKMVELAAALDLPLADLHRAAGITEPA